MLNAVSTSSSRASCKRVGQSAAVPSTPTAQPGTVLVTRCVHFNAAHRLDNPRFDAAWNQRTYGLCNNPNWHGHNYELEVSVLGQPNPETGYVIDLGELKTLLETVILSRCDHRNLNLDVDFLSGIIPSTENLVIAFWNEIAPRLTAGKLHRVRLYESDRNYAEYNGPDYSFGRSLDVAKALTEPLLTPPA